MPGQAWVYSNVGCLYVGRQIAQVIGLGLADALKTCVFQPAGLDTARWARMPADLAGVNMGDARGYHPGWVYHGLVTGTTLDAARLLSALHPDPAYGLGLMLSAHGH